MEIFEKGQNWQNLQKNRQTVNTYSANVRKDVFEI